MKLFFLPWLIASALFMGCGDSSAEGGGPAGGGAEGGGLGSGGGGQVDPNPILEREPAISHDCSEERPMAQETGATNARLEGLVAQGGEFFVTLAAETLAMAKVELDGSVGDPLTLVTAPYAASASNTISDGADVVTVWTENGELNFARVSSALALVDGPSPISGTSGTQVGAAALVPTTDGFALLFGVLGELRFITLAADGQATSDAVAVAQVGDSYAGSASAAPTGDGGFAVTYAAGGAQGSDVYFVILESDGSQRFAPRRISQAFGGGLASGFGFNPRRNLLRVGDDFWVAYVETVSDPEAQEGSTIVRVAVVDDEGNATLHALQAPVDQIENLSPSFVELDDRIGLAWTTGSMIWVCGGCVTDYDMHFVLLDPASLVPASEVVTHLHQTNGINAPIVAVDGADLLTGAMLDFHAVTIPATGALRCVASQ